MRVLLDTNIVLDVLLQRSQWLAEANAIWQASADGRLECCISASSLTDIFYIARRIAGRDPARQAVQRCLDDLSILATDRSILEQAHAMIATDFEDAVQIVTASRDGLDAIITRDAQGFTAATVPVLSPTELAERIGNMDGA